MKKILSIFAFLFIFSLPVSSQAILEFDNSTPQETVKSHFGFLSSKNYKPEIAAFALGNVKYSNKEKRQLIIKLKAILKKHNILIKDIPNKKRLIFSNNKYVFFDDMPEVYLIREGKSWIYSEETVASVNSLYKKYISKSVNYKKALNNEIKIRKESNDTNQLGFFNLSTPYNTIVTHILYLEDSLYNPELSSKTINFSKADKDIGKEEALTVKLKQIYLGASRQIIDFESLSKDTHFIDSLTNRHIYYPNPKVPKLYLEKIGDVWLYSEATSLLINSVHKEMFDQDIEKIFALSDRVKLWLGEGYSKPFGPFQKWQWIMFAVFFACLIFLELIFRTLLKYIIYKINNIERYKRVVFLIIKTTLLLFFLQFSEVYIPSLSLNLKYIHILHKLASIFIILLTTIIALMSVTFIRLYLTRKSAINSKHGIIIFLALIIKSVIIIVSILIAISSLEYELLNVLAGLSIGGFALALGAQDTIRNFFGSLMIFADHPFAVGDYITDGKMYGTVEEVGLRTTRIRTLHGSILSVPNSKLSDSNIDNLGKRQYRRFKSKIILDYSTDSNRIVEFIERIETAFINHPNSRKDYYVINLNDFGLYGTEVLINVFFIALEWKLEMKYKQEFMLEVIRIAKELDIKFAVPPNMHN